MKRLILLLSFAVISILSLSAQYIEVSKDVANIRSGPSTSSVIICQGYQGDIFIIKNSIENWYSIKIGVGKEERYIHKSLCKEVSSLPALPNLSTCKNVFLDFRRAERKAQKSADNEVSTKSSNYIKKLSLTEEKYFSKYTLDVFHKYKIAPALYDEIVDLGFEKGWTN